MKGRAFLVNTPWPQERLGSIADDDYVELFGPLFDDDNSSHQCSSDCFSCPDDQPLWWLVLRWLKMMLLKVARSYHAKPIILVIAPLLVGLTLGYLLGRKRNAYDLVRSRNSWQRIRDWVAEISLRVGLWMDTRNHSPVTHEKVNIASIGTANTPTNISTVKKEMFAGTMDEKEQNVRENLKSDADMQCESGVDPSKVPRHVAVIMDGNRRYGKAKYGNVSKGHWDGSSKLVQFAKWCIAENISVLTVYAFSTENWNRDPAEVASLMSIFAKYCDELRVEALKRNIRIHVLSTDVMRIPAHVQEGMSQMVDETHHCTGLTMNICMSYGSRGELLNATRSIASKCVEGTLSVDRIGESEFENHLLTSHCVDPDVLIRTSGEIRISNFLLWQLAYSEMFFVEKPWPAIEKEDLLHVIRTYAGGRTRRFGK